MTLSYTGTGIGTSAISTAVNTGTTYTITTGGLMSQIQAANTHTYKPLTYEKLQKVIGNLFYDEEKKEEPKGKQGFLTKLTLIKEK